MLAKRRPFKLGRPATGRRDSPGRGGGNKKRRGRAHEAARAPRLSLSHRRRRRATGSCVWIQAAGSATRLWREMRCLLPSAPTKNHDQQADLQFFFSRTAGAETARPIRARFDGRRATFCTRSKQRVSAAPLDVRGIPAVDLLIARSTPLNEARPSPPKARQGRSAPRPSPLAHPRTPGESRHTLIGHAAPPACASAAALRARRPRRGALGPLARPPKVCDVRALTAELIRRAGRLAAHREASRLALARAPVVGEPFEGDPEVLRSLDGIELNREHD